MEELCPCFRLRQHPNFVQDLLDQVGLPELSCVLSWKQHVDSKVVIDLSLVRDIIVFLEGCNDFVNLFGTGTTDDGIIHIH